jgi:hypothetical protein
MPPDNPVPVPGPLPTSVRIWAIDEKEEFYIRTLSPSCEGMFIHWLGKKPYPCLKEECPGERHKKDRFWTGFVHVERWLDKEQVWFPCVMQVSPRLELDFRDVYQRGQVWQISRIRHNGKLRYPVVGVMLQKLKAETLPQPLDILPILRTAYNCFRFVLGEKNPLPPRTLAIPSNDPPPLGIQRRIEEPISRTELRERLQAGMRKKAFERNGIHVEENGGAK